MKLHFTFRAYPRTAYTNNSVYHSNRHIDLIKAVARKVNKARHVHNLTKDSHRLKEPAQTRILVLVLWGKILERGCVCVRRAQPFGQFCALTWNNYSASTVWNTLTPPPIHPQPYGFIIVPGRNTPQFRKQPTMAHANPWINNNALLSEPTNTHPRTTSPFLVFLFVHFTPTLLHVFEHSPLTLDREFLWPQPVFRAKVPINNKKRLTHIQFDPLTDLCGAAWSQNPLKNAKGGACNTVRAQVLLLFCLYIVLFVPDEPCGVRTGRAENLKLAQGMFNLTPDQRKSHTSSNHLAKGLLVQLFFFDHSNNGNFFLLEKYMLFSLTPFLMFNIVFCRYFFRIHSKTQFENVNMHIFFL